MKRVGSAKIEWRLYRRMMNSPDQWQRIYREAMNGEPVSQREPISNRASLSYAI